MAHPFIVGFLTFWVLAFALATFVNGAFFIPGVLAISLLWFAARS